MKQQTPREKDQEQIALGNCVSDRGTDHCPYCVDSCDAMNWRVTVRLMLEELGIKANK